MAHLELLGELRSWESLVIGRHGSSRVLDSRPSQKSQDWPSCRRLCYRDLAGALPKTRSSPAGNLGCDHDQQVRDKIVDNFVYRNVR